MTWKRRFFFVFFLVWRESIFQAGMHRRKCFFFSCFLYIFAFGDEILSRGFKESFYVWARSIHQVHAEFRLSTIYLYFHFPCRSRQ